MEISSIRQSLYCRLLIFPRPGPIPTRLGDTVEISGKKHSTTTAAIIHSTNGSVPQSTSLSGMSGARCEDEKFRPQAGE